MQSLAVRIFTLAITLAAMAMTGPTSASAAASPWEESEGGRIRLVALPPQPDGTVEAILQIDLKPGWKTYWRDPGASGMAPEMDFSASSNISLTDTGFPPPQHLTEGTSSLIGYDRPVSLVLTFRQDRTGKPSVLAGRLLVGICETICIPVMADINLELVPGTPVDPGEFTAVRLASAQLPEKPSTDMSITSADLAATGRQLTMTVRVPDAGTPAIFIANPPGFALGHPAITVNPDGTASVTTDILRQPANASLKGTVLTVLVITGDRSMETRVTPR